MTRFASSFLPDGDSEKKKIILASWAHCATNIDTIDHLQIHEKELDVGGIEGGGGFHLGIILGVWGNGKLLGGITDFHDETSLDPCGGDVGRDGG